MARREIETDACNGDGQVIHKTQPSSFTNTDLKEHIDKLGKKKIVLAGKSHSLIPTTL